MTELFAFHVPGAHAPRNVCRTVLKKLSVTSPTDGIFMYETVWRICSRNAECSQGMGRTE